MVVGDVVLSVSVSVSDSRLASATWSYRWWLDGFGLVDLSGSGVNFADLGVWCVLSQNVSVGMSSMQRFPGLQTQRIPRSGLRTVLQLELVELDLQIELGGLDQLELEVATELISS